MDTIGNLKISEEVIVKIVGKSINEINGVSAAAGSEIMGIIKSKIPYKGIKVEIKDNAVAIEASVVIDYGVKIVDITTQIQESIAKNIQDMCGMTVEKVDIVVSGINVEQKKEEE